MTIQNDDVLLVNQGGTSKRTKYETLKNQIVSDENLVSDAAGSISNDGVQYARKDGGWDAVVIPPAYGDTDVNSLLNQPTANIGEVLSYNGTDYAWIAAPSGGSTSLANTSYTYPNGQQRSAQDRLEDYVSVADFGAVPGTECSAAFQAALDTGRAVYVPAGAYFLDSTITFTGQNVTIIGEGELTSALWFRNSGDGIVVNLVGNGDLNQLRIDGVKILNTAASPGTAIIVSAAQGGDAYNYVDINNVQIRENWTKGIEFNSTSQIKVNNLVAFLNNSSSILHLKGSCLDSSFENMNLGVGSIGLNNVIGMLIDSSSGYAGNEGVRVTNSTFLKCNIGIRYDGSPFEPHLVVSDCHFNCLTNALSLKDVGQSFIHDNLFYAWLGDDTSAIKDASIIYVEGSRGGEHTSIANNVFHAKGRTTVQNIGIEWNAPTTNDSISNISDNIFMSGFTYGIKVTADTDGLICQDNVFDPSMSGSIQIFTTAGNASDNTLVDKNANVIQTVRNKGTDSKSVSLRLQNNNDNLYITQNANSNAEINFKNDLTFNSGFGTSNVVQSMKFHTGGDVEVYHRLLIYNQNNTQRYHIYVDGSGNVVAAQA